MPSYAKSVISFGCGMLLAAWILQLCAQDMVQSNPTITLQEYYFEK